MFENFEIASYHGLRAVARHAGDTETVELADRIISQEQAAADRISGMLEDVAVASLPQAA